MAVEGAVGLGMGGFLCDEGPDLAGQRFGGVEAGLGQAFDEIGLTAREAARERIMPRAGHRVAAKPPARRTRGLLKVPVTGCYGLGHCVGNRRHGLALIAAVWLLAILHLFIYGNL